MKILFINCVTANGGDAAILLSAMKLLRAAFGEQVQFVVQDDHPQVARQHNQHLQIRTSCYWTLMYAQYEGRIGRWHARRQMWRFRVAAHLYHRGWQNAARRLLSEEELGYLRDYQSADLVVATGGTYLTPNYDLGHRFFDMQTAMLFRKPLVLFTQSLGEIENPQDRASLRAVACYAKLVLLRDEASLWLLADIAGERSNFARSPDPAFALADRQQLQRPVDRAPLRTNAPRVAISVREWVYFPDGDTASGMRRYRLAMAKLCQHLVVQYGAHITFVSTCQGIDSYYDDSAVAERIAAAVDAETQSRITVDRAFHRPEELQAKLAECDLVISTRMHMAILGLGVGTPVFPIAYEQKTNELFADLGFSIDIPQIATLTPETLIRDFERFLEFHRQHGEDTRQRVRQYVKQVFDVVPLLESCGPPVHKTKAFAA